MIYFFNIIIFFVKIIILFFIIMNLRDFLLFPERFPNKDCVFCNKKIKLTDKNQYYFQIFGLGKFDKKYICDQCLRKKIYNDYRD